MNRSRSLASILVAALLSACSTDPQSNGGATDGGADPIVDAGTGAGECPVASHAGVDGRCESAVRWSEGPSLPIGVHHHATFVARSDAGAFLYVAGGAKDSKNFILGVARAHVEDDGSLAEWLPGTSLPKSLVGHSVALVGQTVVVTGGLMSSETLSAASYLTTVRPDGNLADWQAGPQIPEGRMHHTTVSAGELVYLIGGSGANGPIGSVYRAHVTAPGVIDGWEAIGSLPEARSHHSVAVTGRFLFLTGGMTEGPDAAARERDVLRAEILEDGSLGPWTRSGELPVALSVHASFVRQGWLYLVGGLKDGDRPSADLFRARVSDDGSVGTWEPASDALPFPRAHVHQVPMADDRFLYSVGGMTAADGTSTPKVSVGRFE